MEALACSRQRFLTTSALLDAKGVTLQYIFEGRNDLDTTTAFSGLLIVILIGLAVESMIFRAIEARTVNLWGMQR